MTRLRPTAPPAPLPDLREQPASNLVKPPAVLDGIRLTPALALIKQRVEYGVREGVPFVLVTGEHGCGKSTAARLLAQKSRTLYWEARPEYTPREVMADLADRLQIEVAEAWRQRTDVITDYMLDHPHTLILDEAQRMGRKTLDQLKYVADNGKITIVLLGSPWLKDRVARWTDIQSRVGVRVEVQPLSQEDLLRLYQKDGYSQGALVAVHEMTRGVYRVIDRLLRHLDVALNDANMDRAQLTPVMVRTVAHEVL